MSLRIKVPLALSLATFLAVGCTTVDQEAEPQSFLVATFDPTTATIPTPNDLALQGAPAQTDPTTRGALFAIIDAGGFITTTGHPLAPLSVISIPLRQVERQADGSYAPSGTPPPTLDETTINASTVAIVRLNGEGAPVAYPPIVAQNAAGVIRLLPQGGYVAGARYVVALRGGDNGVRATDGQPIAAEAPIALILPNRNLNFEENQPIGGLAPAQVAQLEQIRSLYAAPIDWNRVPPPAGTPGPESEAICRAALGIPSAAPFPEQRCWLPPLPPGTFTPGVTPAFDGIDLVFPRTEAASIQVFEIAPAAG